MKSWTIILTIVTIELSVALGKLPPSQTQRSEESFLQKAMNVCFQSQRKFPNKPYTRKSIHKTLNAQAGAQIFVRSKSENGLTLDTDALTDLLSRCVNSNSRNEFLKQFVIKNQKEISRILGSALKNRVIKMQDIDNLLRLQKQMNYRSKREIAVARNVVTDIFNNLIIEPLKNTLSDVIDNITDVLLLYYVDPSDLTNSVQLVFVNMLNTAIQAVVQLLYYLQNNINSLFNFLNPTDTEIIVKNKMLQTRDTFNDFMMNNILTPLKTIVNTAIETIKDLVNSFAIKDSNNVIQNIFNSVINNFVSTATTIITTFQEQLNTFFDVVISAFST